MQTVTWQHELSELGWGRYGDTLFPMNSGKIEDIWNLLRFPKKFAICLNKKCNSEIMAILTKSHLQHSSSSKIQLLGTRKPHSDVFHHKNQSVLHFQAQVSLAWLKT